MYLKLFVSFALLALVLAVDRDLRFRRRRRR